MAEPTSPRRRWFQFSTTMLSLAAVTGCGAVVPADPWIHPGRCVVVNDSATSIEDVYLITDKPPWETKHIPVLGPGETREIDLPQNRIPIADANLVFVNWDEEKYAHISAHVNVVALVGRNYEGDLRFVIRRKSASVEKDMPAQ